MSNCLEPQTPIVKIVSIESFSFEFSIPEPENNSYHFISISLEPEAINSTLHDNLTVSGLVPGTEYTLSVFLHMNESICSSMTQGSLRSNRTIVTPVCTRKLYSTLHQKEKIMGSKLQRFTGKKLFYMNSKHQII